MRITLKGTANSDEEARQELRKAIHRKWPHGLDREDEIIDAIRKPRAKVPHKIRAIATAVEFDLLVEIFEKAGLPRGEL